MKVQPNQTNNDCHGMTTYALSSVNEAIALVLSNDAFKKGDFGELPKRILESYEDVKFDFKEVNPKARFDAGAFGKSWDLDNHLERFQECVKAINSGDLPGYPNIVADAKALGEELKDLVLDMEPSLKLDTTWNASEDSPMFDAAGIAAGVEKPCFEKSKPVDILKEGKGDGAFRIVVNTDVFYGSNPMFQVAALCALIDIVQNKGPIELWVQQGWLGNQACDGVTLFPVHKGGALDLKAVVFWVAHPYRDSCFSYLVNRALGRRRSAVSREVELPCDLYLYGVMMPDVHNEKDKAAEWVKQTARKMLFEEEDPSKWGDA